MRLFDSHVHLDLPAFGEDRAAVLARAAAAGVAGMVNVGFDLPSSRRSIEMVGGSVRAAAVGIHPHEAGSLDREGLVVLRDLARLETVRAVGEIGLDFYRNLSPREVQTAAFRKQLELAGELGLPVIIHARESYPEVLQILREIRPGRAVIHCFQGDRAMAEAFLELGFYLGVGGSLTFRANAELRRVVREIPAERILLETDSPYLTPEPFRGRRNEPARVVLVAEALARERGEEPEEVARVTWENARKFFAI